MLLKVGRANSPHSPTKPSLPPQPKPVPARTLGLPTLTPSAKAAWLQT